MLPGGFHLILQAMSIDRDRLWCLIYGRTHTLGPSIKRSVHRTEVETITLVAATGLDAAQYLIDMIGLLL